MLVELLKKCVHKNTPIYLGQAQIVIIEIYEEFGLVDIKFVAEDTIFAVDAIALTDEPYIEKSICIKRLLEV